MIYEYMSKKADEHGRFDPRRAPRVYEQLEPKMRLYEPYRGASSADPRRALGISPDQAGRSGNYKIHVMGTNGKGSTGRFIAQSLYEQGYSVMHFTSPHLLDFRERFFVNCEVVSLEHIEHAHSFLQQFDFVEEASYFEYATFLAMVLGQECDFWVMEAGVGGELDSTSVLKYQSSLYTRIGLDHLSLLGGTVQEIAKTKLKAMQGDVFLHFMSEDIKHIAQDMASRKPGVRLHFLQEGDIDNVKGYAASHSMPYFLTENLALANLFLSSIEVPLLRKPLALRGRMERISDNIWIDVGHNEMAALGVRQALGTNKVTLIYNSYKDKPVKRMLEILRDNIISIVVMEIDDNKRVMNTEELLCIIENLGLEYSTEDMRVEDLLDKDRLYMVFGGFAVVERFLQRFEASLGSKTKLIGSGP